MKINIKTHKITLAVAYSIQQSSVGTRLLRPTIGICIGLMLVPFSGTAFSRGITAAKPLIVRPSTDSGPAGTGFKPSDRQKRLSETNATNSKTPSGLQLSEKKPNDTSRGAKANTLRTHHENGNLESEREVHTNEKGMRTNHGKFQLWDSQGGLVANGNYKNGQPAGQWKRLYRDQNGSALLNKDQVGFDLPLISTFQFTDGLLDGLWVIADANGRTVRKWNFRRGKLHGEMAIYFSSGSRMLSATYDQNVPTGMHREWTNEGEMVEALRFEHGRLLADVTHRWPDGTIQATGRQLQPRYRLTVTPEWWNGKIRVESSDPIGEPQKKGDWTYYTRQGKPLQKGTYVRGEREGLFTWWYPGGQLHARGDFIAGSPHGEWTWWHANGTTKAIGYYNHGTQAGDWVTWDDKGAELEVVRHAPMPDAPSVQPPPKKPSAQRIDRRTVDIPRTADRETHRNHRVQPAETTQQ